MPPSSRAESPGSVYLDHAAATPLRAEVAAAMESAASAAYANPSSPHAAGRQARRVLEEARERILALLGCHASGRARDRLVFTSGATEANRLGVLGVPEFAGTVGLSARDHASVAAAARALEARGWRSVTLPLDADGRLEPGGDWHGHGPGLLCITVACGQTGVVEDLARVADWSGVRADRRVHADATQALAWWGPSFPNLGAATMACAPHKFGGPRGIGALVVRAGSEIVPVSPGTQELGLRGGTEAVSLAVGFARALELALAERLAGAEQLGRLRAELESRIAAAAAAAGLEAHVLGAATVRAPHIATIAFPGLDRQALVMAADLEGLCLASGSACSSGSTEPAPALVAMGLPAGVTQGAVRLSLGRTTTAADVAAAAERLGRVFHRLKT